MSDYTVTFSGSEAISWIFDGCDFILDKPEPIKEDIKFTVHDMGAIKGTLRRTEIYEDR